MSKFNMKFCTVKQLPIKNLKWERLVPLIGQARERVARYDEALKKLSSSQLEKMRWAECASSLVNQDRQKIQFAKEGLEFAIRWAGKKPLNEMFLCKVHAIVKQDGRNPKEIGRYRVRQNWIGKDGCAIEEAYFYPPPARKIKGYMKVLSRYMKGKELDPLVQLAIFFGQFLIIHPFMDGNGRVARIFIPTWLWKKGLISEPALFLSAYFERNRQQYFLKLYNISAKKDWEGWIEYFLKGVIEQTR